MVWLSQPVFDIICPANPIKGMASKHGRRAGAILRQIGELNTVISQNVYDTATGRDLLLPQGSKLFGAYDSRVVYGQSRVLIAWNRVIFPDGSSVTLGAMPGTDISGYAGFKDKVDNHYLRIFGSDVLMSLVSGGMSYAVDQVSNNDSDSDGTSMQDEMIAVLAVNSARLPSNFYRRES